MKTRYLFPHRFKKLGWVLFLPSLVLGLLLFAGLLELPWLDVKVFALYNPKVLGDGGSLRFIENNIADEVVSCFLIVGTLLVACSEVKEEDEYIGKLRLESLLWALYVNAGLLLFCVFFFYGLGFYNALVFHLFTLLVLFLGRFHLVLYRATKAPAYEE
ncbi:hypothetical protein [Rufibacter psychrotolerans]|uniref:hypothetical protein n=1 Tax=Rufibacter psychrotolerans TaxID=2812556 RepID=UPI001F083245|nr:hypothetical protein [Rufibacter sp. SYSU D00308]